MSTTLSATPCTTPVWKSHMCSLFVAIPPPPSKEKTFSLRGGEVMATHWLVICTLNHIHVVVSSDLKVGYYLAEYSKKCKFCFVLNKISYLVFIFAFFS